MDMINQFDVIVIGGGPIGLAAAYQCAVKQDKRVVLLEKFDEFANAYGSSPGYSRQFRYCYSEMNICELALKTYDMWQDLMKDMDNMTLLQETGCFWFGDSNAKTSEGNIDEAIENLEKLNLKVPCDYRVLDGKHVIINDPQFKFVSSAVKNIEKAKGLFTTKGGTINVPSVVNCYVEALNKSKFATLHKRAQITKIDYTNDNYVEVWATVQNTERRFRCTKIILTPGIYVNDLLNIIFPPFEYEINLAIYIWCSTYFTKKLDCPSGNDPTNWPVWYFFGPNPDKKDAEKPTDYKDYYGFPCEPDNSENIRVCPAFTSETQFIFYDYPPSICERPLDEHALNFTSKFVEEAMPDLNQERKKEHDTVCLAGFAELVESKPIDKSAGFVLDFLKPDLKRIVLFTGGWAMKFVPMFGKILADLAIQGKTEYQDLIDPMNINRGILKKKEGVKNQKKNE
ncbi:putative bifunctional amine oxidase DDB_G0291301 [Xenia sp. Carnegie-2017]|uniref:putative bifunctional amine oxidase DDB_G0291301 n=1 Tax=Xenia sp. Carnegie-2017 TaxID=2897299 RepID=UPI001F036740|nr:putative bifunctional amine oxidase DDB_G0291301 [Xenia sp. Carnegie-2017]